MVVLTKKDSQEAEGDEKAEVLVSFSSNHLVHICQDINTEISYKLISMDQLN